MRLRTVLYAPGHDERRIREAAKSGADAVILDLEDTVPLAQKKQARDRVRDALEKLDFGETSILARINTLSSGLGNLDLNAVIHPRVQGIRVPKVEESEELQEISIRIDELEQSRGIVRGQIRLLPIVESPHGLLNAQNIASSTERNLAISLGLEDFTAEMGINREGNQIPLMFAKFYLSTCAAAAKVIALDSVFMNIRDEEGLKEEARMARNLGFSGKCLIHPCQIKIVETVFTPSAEDINQANKIIEAFKTGVEKGDGLILIEGKMIDLPVVNRAKRVLAQAGLL